MNGKRFVLYKIGGKSLTLTGSSLLLLQVDSHMAERSYKAIYMQRGDYLMISFQKYRTRYGYKWLYNYYLIIDQFTGEKKQITKKGFATKEEAQLNAAQVELEHTKKEAQPTAAQVRLERTKKEVRSTAAQVELDCTKKDTQLDGAQDGLEITGESFANEKSTTSPEYIPQQPKIGMGRKKQIIKRGFRIKVPMNKRGFRTRKDSQLGAAQSRLGTAEENFISEENNNSPRYTSQQPKIGTGRKRRVTKNGFIRKIQINKKGLRVTEEVPLDTAQVALETIEKDPVKKNNTTSPEYLSQQPTKYSSTKDVKTPTTAEWEISFKRMLKSPNHVSLKNVTKIMYQGCVILLKDRNHLRETIVNPDAPAKMIFKQQPIPDDTHTRNILNDSYRRETPWHYTIGNKDIYPNLRDNERGWLAGNYSEDERKLWKKELLNNEELLSLLETDLPTLLQSEKSVSEIAASKNISKKQIINIILRAQLAEQTKGKEIGEVFIANILNKQTLSDLVLKIKPIIE